MPTQPGVTVANPHILTAGLIVGVCCLAISVAGICLSLFWRHGLFARIRQLTLLPMLFMLCTSIIFCVASISVGALYSGCGPADLVGRYVVPLVVALPFFIAAAFSIPAMFVREGDEVTPAQKEGLPASQVAVRPTVGPSPMLASLQAGLLATLLLYFFAQGVAYIKADPGYTFQATGCVADDPANVDSIISYMRSTHIRYAWATGWIGDPITFKTDGMPLVAELHSRLPANSAALLHADRPSIILLVRHSDVHPLLLQIMDRNNVTYRIARLFSVPGVDTMIVTPLNQAVSPLDPNYAPVFDFLFGGCV